MASISKGLSEVLIYRWTSWHSLRTGSCANRGPVLAPIAKVLPRGSVLLIALWSLSLLTVFAVYLGNGVRQKIVLVEMLNSRDSLHFIAEAGVKQAISELRNKESFEYACLNEPWSSNPAVFKSIEAGLGEFSVAYDYLDHQSGQLESRYGLIDEERKLNLNQSELEVIQRLIMLVGGLESEEAQNLAAALVDWRDSDHTVSIPLGSAEDSYYQGLTHPYEAKDSAFEVFEELLLVRGMSQGVFEKLKEYITIYGNNKININTASEFVLQALGLEEALAEKIISFRRGDDAAEATDDDNIFISPPDIVSKLNESVSLSPEEIAVLNNLVSAGRLSTDSSNFMARVTARLGRRQAQIISIFDKEGKILFWKES
ncbi:general secretion pathway protein GspK [Candidatus Omnitrophota bacterium]